MPAPKTDDEFEFEKLKLLFDYTKFHIGVYLTVAGVFAGFIAANAKDSNSFLFKFDRPWLIAAVAFIAIAGFAGGVLVSSMCHERSLANFWKKKLGPFWFEWWPAEWWTYIEHAAFWVAIACALYAFYPK